MSMTSTLKRSYSFPKYSPLYCPHFFCLSTHLSYTFKYQSLSIPEIIRDVAVLSSFKFLNFLPLSCDFIKRNTVKSIGTKFGLYGACSRVSNPSNWISSKVVAAACAGALSWWSIIVSKFSESGGLFFRRDWMRSLLKTWNESIMSLVTRAHTLTRSIPKFSVRILCTVVFERSHCSAISLTVRRLSSSMTFLTNVKDLSVIIMVGLPERESSVVSNLPSRNRVYYL